MPINYKEYENLLKRRNEMLEALSTTIKIDHWQVMEIVVADLLSKYKFRIKNHDEYTEPFRNVLRFYLEEEELEYLLSQDE